MVYVVSENGQPLMPTENHAKVRVLLKTGKAKAIRFSTLETICKVLECQPADILEYSEAKK